MCPSFIHRCRLVALMPYFLECHGSDDKVPVSGDAGSGGLEVCLLYLHCLPYLLTPVPLTLHLQRTNIVTWWYEFLLLVSLYTVIVSVFTERLLTQVETIPNQCTYKNQNLPSQLHTLQSPSQCGSPCTATPSSRNLPLSIALVLQ